jgi:hypothetical protein
MLDMCTLNDGPIEMFITYFKQLKRNKFSSQLRNPITANLNPCYLLLANVFHLSHENHHIKHLDEPI